MLCFKGGFVQLFQTAASEAVPANENKRTQRLCDLALRIASHLKWNLEILEERYF